MDSKPTLGYWSIRGLGQTSRFLLAYLNVDFNDRIYNIETENDLWEADKVALNMHFPNLPYFIDGDVKISESSAILQFIADKYRPAMLGETLEQRAVVRELGGVIADIKGYLVSTCYSSGFAESIDTVLVECSEEVKKIAKFLGEKPFLIGDQITWPDFNLFELLEHLEAVRPGTVANISPKIVEFRNRIASLPGVAEIVSKLNYRWNGLTATWR